MVKTRWHPPAAVKKPVRQALAYLGFELVRLQRPDTLFVQHLLQRHGIDLMLDIGANQGQYAIRMRNLGYNGDIVSFEPGRDAFRRLQRISRNDPKWQAKAVALGSEARNSTLTVSCDSLSSSLLAVAPIHVAAAPSSVAHHQEAIRVERLDDCLAAGDLANKKVWVKLDTQGYELEVVKGAVETLAEAVVVQTELSILPCYDGQADYRIVINTLHDMGFALIFVEPGTQEPTTGEMLQFDAIFERGPTGAEGWQRS